MQRLTKKSTTTCFWPDCCQSATYFELPGLLAHTTGRAAAVHAAVVAGFSRQVMLLPHIATVDAGEDCKKTYVVGQDKVYQAGGQASALCRTKRIVPETVLVDPAATATVMSLCRL